MSTGRQQQYTSEQVVEALQQTHGIMHRAAQKLGCDRRTIYRYAQRYAAVRQELEEQQEIRLDIGEDSLMSCVIAREPWAVALLLKTLGKERGYVERSEQRLSGADGGPIKSEHRVSLESYREYFESGGHTPATLAGNGAGESLDTASANGKAGRLPDGLGS
jgi:ParB-like chromosome segregation protein Spo0J